MTRFYGARAKPYGGARLGGGGYGGRGHTPYAEIVLADSPSGFWRLDEASGVAANDEVGTNDGTYDNTPTLGVASLAPDGTGSAVTCVAGNSERIRFPGNSLTTNGSIEFWFDDWTAGAALLRDSTSAGGTGWIVHDSAGTFSVRIAGTTDIATSKTTAQMRDGNRHHVVVTKSGANVVVYVDNVIVGTSSSAANTASVSPWILCRNGDIGAHTTATVDEFAIYPTALSAARVSAHYNAT